MNGMTVTEIRTIVTWDKSNIRVGDVVAYTRRTFSTNLRKYRMYGIVKRIDDDTLWLIRGSEEHGVEDFGLPIEFAHEIEYVLRNGVKPE